MILKRKTLTQFEILTIFYNTHKKQSHIAFSSGHTTLTSHNILYSLRRGHIEIPQLAHNIFMKATLPLLMLRIPMFFFFFFYFFFNRLFRFIIFNSFFSSYPKKKQQKRMYICVHSQNKCVHISGYRFFT